MVRRSMWSLVAGLVLAGTASAVLAVPAAAHVRVDNGEELSKGGYGLVRLVVPTESDTASTVGVTVTIPEGVDLTSARTLPIPGWTATVEREQSGDGQRVSRIIWQAADPAQGVKTGEFGVFTLSAGLWPEDVDSVPLPSDQTYSDGSAVSWNEVVVNDGIDPEYPAPVVTLVDGSGHGDGHGATTTGSPSAVAASDSGSDDHAAAAVSGSASAEWLWQTVAALALVLSIASTAAVIVLLRRGHVAKS